MEHKFTIKYKIPGAYVPWEYKQKTVKTTSPQNENGVWNITQLELELKKLIPENAIMIWFKIPTN